MELVEVLVQGVAGSPQLARWTFPAGACVVPAGEREALLARVAFELVAGVPDGTIAALGAKVGRNGNARVGVVVVGRDQRRYRILCDLASERRLLQVQRDSSWDTLSSSQAEIAQAMTATAGFPQADALREVFFAFADDVPSRRRSADRTTRAGAGAQTSRAAPPGFDGAARLAASKPLPPGFADAESTTRETFAGRSDDDLRAQLATLKERAAANDVAALEFEFDGLQKQLFDIDMRRKPLRSRVDELDARRSERDAGAALDAVTEEFTTKRANLRTLEVDESRNLQRFDDDEKRLKAAIATLPYDAGGDGRPPRPLRAAQRDPFIRLGLGVGVGAILVGLLGALVAEQLRWVALLNIPAFGAAVLGGNRLLLALEEGAVLRQRLRQNGLERARERDRLNIDREQLDHLLTRHGLPAGAYDVVEEQIAARRVLLQRIAALEEAHRDDGIDSVLGALDTTRADVAAQIKVLEARLERIASGADAMAAALAQEIFQVEQALSEREAAKKATSNEGAAVAEVVIVDVGQQIAAAAADLLVAPLDVACNRIGPRASQIVVAVSRQRFSEVRFGPRGEVSVVDAIDHKAIAFTSLPALDRDLVALALRLAVIGAFTEGQRMPVVIDRALDHLGAEHAPLLTRALQFISQSTQVVLVTAHREYAGVGAVITATTQPT